MQLLCVQKHVHVSARPAGVLGAAAVQELLEEIPEFSVEDGVDDRVESAVDIAKPRHHAHQGRGDVAALTPSSHDVEDKEGGPAEEKGTCRRSRRIKN